MATLCEVLFLVLIAGAWPVYDQYFEWPRFRRELATGVRSARRRLYVRALVIQCTAALVGLAIWSASSNDWRIIGLNFPSGLRLVLAAILCAIFLAFQSYQASLAGRSTRLQEKIREAVAASRYLSDLLPRTRNELLLFVSLGVTAGICEELIFRGLLPRMAARFLWFPLAATASLAAFVALHAYQDGSGMRRSGTIGLIFLLLTLATRSVLPAMVLHAAVDVGSALLLWTVYQRTEPQADTL